MKDGTAQAYHVARALAKKHPEMCVLSVDVSGAHSNLRRDVLDAVLAQKAPGLQKILRQWYGTPTLKTWRGKRRLPCSRRRALARGRLKRARSSVSASPRPSTA